MIDIDAYIVSINGWMDSLEAEKWISITSVCKAENIDRFMDVIKDYIHKYQGSHELSDDYTAVRRRRLFVENKVTQN